MYFPGFFVNPRSGIPVLLLSRMIPIGASIYSIAPPLIPSATPAWLLSWAPSPPSPSPSPPPLSPTPATTEPYHSYDEHAAAPRCGSFSTSTPHYGSSARRARLSRSPEHEFVLDKGTDGLICSYSHSIRIEPVRCHVWGMRGQRACLGMARYVWDATRSVGSHDIGLSHPY